MNPSPSDASQHAASTTTATTKGPRARSWLWMALFAIVILLVGTIYWRWQSSSPSSTGAGAPSTQSANNAKGDAAGRPGGARMRRGGGRPPGAALPVGVATATLADVPIYLSGLGSVSPETATVQSLVTGLLTKINFKEGQMVKSGFVLAELDPRPFEVQVTQAEGQLARDTATLNEAKVDLKRYETLWKQDSIAKQVLDTQATLVKQTEGTVKLDQGNLDNARLQLLYSKITAPTSGRMGLRQVDLGNNITANTTNIVVITKLQPILVIFTLPEDTIPRVMRQVKAGVVMPVEAWNRDLTEKLADGHFLAIDNIVDSTTGTVRLRAEFPNNDFALYPSQFVNIKMLLETRKDATTIPSAAIQRGPQGQFVYVVKPDKTVTLRVVSVGPVDGENTTIEKGVDKDEVVVVDGLDKLREGIVVEPIERSLK